MQICLALWRQGKGFLPVVNGSGGMAVRVQAWKPGAEAGVDFGDVPVELEVTYRDVSRTPCLVPRALGSQERADGDGDGDGVTGWSLRPAGAPARPTRVRVIRAGCRSPRLAPDRASPGRPALEDLINDLEQGVRSR